MLVTFSDNIGKPCGFYYNDRFRTGNIDKVRSVGGKVLVTVALSNRQEGESTHKGFYVHKMVNPAVYA